MRRKSNGHVPNWNKIRADIWERDRWCVICGDRGRDIHHVVYRSHGGKDTEDNLVLLCRDCHSHLHDNNPNMAMRRRGIRSEQEAQEYLKRYLKLQLWKCRI